VKFIVERFAMSHQASSSNAGYGIEDVYKGVIADVINSMKETFLDEAIDIDVLNQLKSEWENKLHVSGALNFDNNQSIPPPALRQPQIKQQPMTQIYVSQPAPGPSNFMQQQQRVTTGFVQTAPGPSNFSILPQQQLRQVPVNVQAKPVAKSDYGVKQLDGGGPGMTDSSSSEEEDEDDDQMGRFMGLQDEHANDAETVDEDPLNSNDDQSDDEDLETLFQSENVIVCQFEKVNRARTKWKFTLKDGIMHLNGKDYCFQKCTGEAEW